MIVADYLRRLGVESEPPSVDALFRLHRAHVERIPYETFWIHLGQPWGIAVRDSLSRIARTPRGGYCYMLNGAFAQLLTALGYTVTRHVAGAHDASGPDVRELGNHVALIVDGLPSDASPDGRWYIDAGLGDAIHSPMPLRPIRDEQGPNWFALERVASDGVGDWHLARDDGGSFAGISIVDRPVGMRTFVAQHRHHVTSPDSGYRRTVTAQLRFLEGKSVLRGCVHTRVRGDRVTTLTCESLGEWRDLLADEFGMTFDLPLDALWTSVRRTHDAWLAQS